MALSRKKQRMKQPDWLENGDGNCKTRTFVFQSHKESLSVKIIEVSLSPTSLLAFKGWQRTQVLVGEGFRYSIRRHFEARKFASRNTIEFGPCVSKYDKYTGRPVRTPLQE